MPWLELLDETIGACAAHHRPDLAHRLRQKRAQLLDSKLRVAVVGESNQGKSQLINALINAPVCAVGDDVTTTTPTVVHHADAPSAVLVTDPVTTGNGTRSGGPERVPIPVEQIGRQISGKPGTMSRGELVTAEVGIPRKLLSSGLVLIDTPAIGSTRSTAGAAQTIAALDQADAVVLASAATHEFSATELDLLVRVAKSCPNVVVALTKIDLAPNWRQVVDHNRARLDQAGVTAKIVGVSAALRLQAARTGDKVLNAESGFPDLLACLQSDVLTQPDVLARRCVAVMATTAVAEIVAALRAEQTAVGSTQVPAAVARVKQAQRRLDDLRRQSTRWQTVLLDETTDLIADLEYDLRERTRRILHQVDSAFDETDPSLVWNTFEEWLTDNLTEMAATHVTWLVDRFEWIAQKVALGFPPHLPGLMPASIIDIPDDLAYQGAVAEPKLAPFTLGQKIFTGLRGSYGGVLMFGLVSSLAGLPLINPISLGAGAAFGGKSIREESEARMRRRQAMAKAAVSRHVDDFFLKFGKDCKDVVRQTQRRLRDHFSALAERLQDRAVDAVGVAKEEAQAEAVAQDRRSRQIKVDLDKLVALHSRARALVTTAAAGSGLGITA